jgi:hypothetical protein
MSAPYRVLYSCFSFRNWRRSLLVSTMFWAIRVHFAHLLSDAGVHPPRQAMVVNTPYTRSMTELASGCCCMVILYSSLRDSVRFYQSFWNSGVGTLAMVWVTTTVLSYTIHQSLIRSASCNSQSQSHIATDGQSVSQSVLVSSPHLGFMTRCLILCLGSLCITSSQTAYKTLPSTVPLLLPRKPVVYPAIA